MAPIDVVDDVVARGEGDHRDLTRFGIGRRARPLSVEHLGDLGGHPSIAHGVQHGFEPVVGLPMDLHELTHVQRCAVPAEVHEAVGVAHRRARPHLRVEEPE